MKTQLITALIFAVAGAAMAQRPSQTEFRGRNSGNAPLRARQRLDVEADAPQFQRPAHRAATADEEAAPEAPAPRGPQARQGFRGERPQLPPTEGAPAARPGRRGPGGPQGRDRVRGERPQFSPEGAPAFAPRRAASDEASDAPVRARHGRRGVEGAERPEAQAPIAGRRGPSGLPREDMRRRGRQQQEPEYRADECEYESEADRAIRAAETESD